MTQAEFNEAVARFNCHEPMRAELYHRALRLIDAGFRIEAHLLILATWNFARFRYVTKTFKLADFDGTLASITKELSPFCDSDLMDSELTGHKTQIAWAFDQLASFEGIRYTGAAKVLHLLFPRFFVMWDRFINGQYPKRHYLNLKIVQSGFWPYRKYACGGDGYFDFLDFCQKNFRAFVSPDPRKPLAKCIDEFNFCMITWPIANSLQVLPDAE